MSLWLLLLIIAILLLLLLLVMSQLLYCCYCWWLLILLSYCWLLLPSARTGWCVSGRLVMGTRCGDLDPAVVLYIQNATGRGPKEMDKLFNKESGLLGLAGKSDIRAILEESAKGSDRANLAMNVGHTTPPPPSCDSITNRVGVFQRLPCIACLASGLDLQLMCQESLLAVCHRLSTFTAPLDQSQVEALH